MDTAAHATYPRGMKVAATRIATVAVTSGPGREALSDRETGAVGGRPPHPPVAWLAAPPHTVRPPRRGRGGADRRDLLRLAGFLAGRPPAAGGGRGARGGVLVAGVGPRSIMARAAV